MTIYRLSSLQSLLNALYLECARRSEIRMSVGLKSSVREEFHYVIWIEVRPVVQEIPEALWQSAVVISEER